MRTNNGFAAIAPIIIIGGMILAVTGGVALRARQQVLDDIGALKGAQALVMAYSCVEIAIGKLQTVFGYNGNETINTDDINCVIAPITGTGNYDRIITASTTIDGYEKNVQVIISQISAPTKISSWKETQP